MFSIVKRNDNIQRYWIGESSFIDKMIALLQKDVDESDFDIRLRFHQTFSFPKRYWKIVLELPDGIVVKDSKELDSIGEMILEQFKVSDAHEKAKRTLFNLTKLSKHQVNYIDISYVICSSCGKKKKPGIIIYWAR